MVTVMEGWGSEDLAVEWMGETLCEKMQQHAGIDVLRNGYKRTQLTTQRLQVVNTAYSSNICNLLKYRPAYNYAYVQMAHRVPVCCSVYSCGMHSMMTVVKVALSVINTFLRGKFTVYFSTYIYIYVILLKAKCT